LPNMVLSEILKTDGVENRDILAQWQGCSSTENTKKMDLRLDIIMNVLTFHPRKLLNEQGTIR
jgi:hypothetical protein